MTEIITKADLLGTNDPVMTVLDGTGTPKTPEPAGILDVLKQINQGLQTIKEIASNIQAVKNATGQATDNRSENSAAPKITTEGVTKMNTAPSATITTIDTDALLIDIEGLLPTLTAHIEEFPEIANTKIKDLPTIYAKYREIILPQIKKQLEEKLPHYIYMRPVA